MRTKVFIKKWVEALFIAQWFNFFVFIGFALYSGGEALNGKVEFGKYFLGMHGKYKEVSQIEYSYSMFYSIFTVSMHLFVILAAFVLNAFSRKVQINEIKRSFTKAQISLIVGFPIFWFISYLIVKNLHIVQQSG